MWREFGTRSIGELRDADFNRSEALIVVHGGRGLILAAHDFDSVVDKI